MTFIFRWGSWDMGTLSTLFRISSGIRHQALDFQVESRQFTSRQDCFLCVLVLPVLSTFRAG